MTVNELIESAFAAVPYPGDDNITRCTHADCLECEEIAAHFRGTTWRDHTIKKLWQFNSAIALFTPPAFHYFLPAFMIQSLGRWDAANEIPNFIAYQFLPSKPGMQQYHLERWQLLNQRQREAIAAFLREYLNSHSADYVPDRADIEQTISRLSG